MNSQLKKQLIKLANSLAYRPAPSFKFNSFIKSTQLQFHSIPALNKESQFDAANNGEEPEVNNGELDPFVESKDFATSGSDWSKSFYGVGSKSFPREVIDILLAPVETKNIEIKPDGLLYLPEIKFRRVLNQAFGPGGWGLVPRGPSTVNGKNLSREYALVCQGRFVSQARGEQDYFDKNDLSMSSEGARSNALTRCCKDLGIASELWDPSFVRQFKLKNCEQVWVENVQTKKRRLLWRLKGSPIDYPFKLSQFSQT